MRAQGRTAAIAGAVVAVGAATMMGITGIASATPAGSCLENVNVRAEPSMDARIVAVCEAGTAVDTGETRNGFVRIIDLGGWAAEEYIAVDESTAPDTTSTPADSSDTQAHEPCSPTTTVPVDGTTPTVDTTGDAGSFDSTGPDSTDTGTADFGTDDTGTDDTGTGSADTAEPASPVGGFGGLLG
ncbi:MAG: SH3 domain-containing protein [Pseudonocardia sp.]|nr:SH3 domain-containing protein [Pseudonocardia sp.]